MSRIISLIVLAWAMVAHAQTVNTNDPAFTPVLRTITAPAGPLTLLQDQTGVHPATFPLGPIDVSFTLVDQYDRHSGMSPVTTINPQHNWQLVVSTPGVSRNTPAVATCWWYRTGSTWSILGGGAYCSDPRYVTRPYLPLTGYQFQRYKGHLMELSIFHDWNYSAYWWPTWDDPFWQKGSTIAAPLTAPECRVYDKPIPKQSIRIAFSWACNLSESPLSLPITLPAVSDGRVGVLMARDLTPPQGAVGMYIYVSIGMGPWHRQPAPHVTVPVGLDDYLWRVDQNWIKLEQFHCSNIQPNPAPGQSVLSRLHLALDGVNGKNCNICVTEDQEIRCPLIMPLSNALGNSIGRTISAPNGARWNITTVVDAGWPSAWPIWCENSQDTRLVGCQMSSQTACGGVSFFGVGNTGPQRFQAERVQIYLGAPRATGIATLGDHCHANSSEHTLRAMVIYAHYPVVIEGNQARSWVFEHVTANTGGQYDSAAFTMNNAGDLVVKGRCNCEGGRALVACVSAGEVELENVATDLGHPELFVCGFSTLPRIRASFKSLNIRIPFIHYVTQTSPNAGIVKATFRGSNSEPCSDVCLFTTRYNGISFTGDTSNSSKNLVVRQPLQANWQNSPYWLRWDGGVVAIPPGQVIVP